MDSERHRLEEVPSTYFLLGKTHLTFEWVEEGKGKSGKETLLGLQTLRVKSLPNKVVGRSGKLISVSSDREGSQSRGPESG